MKNCELTFEYVVNDTTTTTGENTNEATQNRKEPMMMEHDELCVIRSDLFLDMALPNEKCHHQKSPGLFRLFIFMAYFCFNPKRYEKMFTGWLGSLYIPSLIFLRISQKYYSTRIL